MPVLLKHDTIRMLEASVNCLEIAIANLYHTKRINFKQQSAAYAPEIGLVGTSVELAMSACLIQTYGVQIIKLDTGMFKTGRWIIDDFLNMLKVPPKNSEYLTLGIVNPKDHINKLTQAARSLRILITCRAAGFHAGKGVSLEVALVKTSEAITFLNLLKLSTRLSPYFSYIPELLSSPPDRKLIIEDLYKKMKIQSKDKVQDEITNIFLILPELSDEMPQWLEPIERIQIAPKLQDIEYLINTLDSAVPVSLRRIRDGSSDETLTFRHSPNDPNAIPVLPQFYKRQFNQIYEQFYAYIGIANGELEKNKIQVPNAEFIKSIFILGIDQSGILMGKQNLTPAESWAAIVASVIAQGTSGPFWFIIRKTPDIDQLVSILNKVSVISKPYNQRRILNLIQMIKGYENDQADLVKIPEILDICREIELCKGARKRLLGYLRNKSKSVDTLARLQRYSEESSALSEIYSDTIALNPNEMDALLARCFIEASNDYEDIEMVNDISAKFDKVVSTNVRKAYRRIDFSTFGPSLELSGNLE